MKILTQLMAWFSPRTGAAGSDGLSGEPITRTIDFDMMLRGNLYERPSGTVRQCSVTVNGATQLVTTGDTVTSEVYDALVESGIVLGAESDSTNVAKAEKDSTN
ncbi:MAG: hypothetical protein VCD00_13270 [Candidatus Hydrogenedentota bacterium]